MATISAHDVLGGDVLLVRGTSFISWAIRLFDGTDVNHSALVVGDGEIGEAAGDGLRYAGVEETVRRNERVWSRRLVASSDLTPVVRRGRWYVDQKLPYAYQQILLLAVLCVTRRVPLGNPLVRRAVSRTLDRAAALLNALDAEGRTAMICSEYVYRCYDEAVPGPGDAYTLDLPRLSAAPEARGALAEVEELHVQPGSLLLRATAPPAEAAPAPVASSEALLPDAVAELETLYGALAAQVPLGLVAEGVPAVTVPETSDDELADATSRFVAGLQPGRAWAEAATAVADFVTPGDLLRTPSLRTVGQVVV